MVIVDIIRERYEALADPCVLPVVGGDNPVDGTHAPRVFVSIAELDVQTTVFVEGDLHLRFNRSVLSLDGLEIGPLLDIRALPEMPKLRGQDLEHQRTISLLFGIQTSQGRQRLSVAWIQAIDDTISVVRPLFCVAIVQSRDGRD
jgi:hypothetical protein